MNDEWVWLWFRCLKLNKPYERYCAMRRTKIQKERTALERQYPQIAEVYEDFGDVHSFNERSKNRKYWKEWYAERKGLFINSSGNSNRLTTVPKKLNDDYLYLKIAPQKTVEETISEAEKLIRKHLAKVRKRKTAKYKLATNTCGINVIRGLRRSLTVWHKLKPLEGKAPTQKRLVDQLVKSEVGRKEDWAWDSSKPGTKDEWRWTEKYVEEVGYENAIRSVQRFRDRAQTIIDNTVHGRFPDDK